MKTISIMYRSGDSFSTWEAENKIPAIWENRNIAQEALFDIYEQYEYYEKIYGNNSKENPAEKQRLYEEVINKRWYLSTKGYYEYTLEGSEGIEGLKDCLDIDLENMKDKYNTWRSDYTWSDYIMLTLDNGIKLRVHCFWLGHFEQFNDAEIVDIEELIKVN